MRRAVLSLGSNLGDRVANLRIAVAEAALVPELRRQRCSPVYETTPVGGPSQGHYLNAVLVAETEVSPRVLLALAHDWEQVAGRERVQRWGPRTLDVDVVALGDLTTNDARVTLPHPRAHERAFVLVPWSDVDPSAVLPGHGSVGDLVATVDRTGVRRRDDLSLDAS